MDSSAYNYSIVCTKKLKIIIISSTVCLLLTFLNPLVKDFVAAHIVGTSVYWRLGWLFQNTFVMVCASSLLLDETKKGKRTIQMVGAFTCFLVVALWIYQSQWTYTTDNQKTAENYLKLGNETIEIADAILEYNEQNEFENYPLVMLPRESCEEIRQYTAKLRVGWTKYVKRNVDIYPDENYWKVMNDLYTSLYQTSFDYGEVLQIAGNMGIDYIAFYKNESTETHMQDYPCVYENNRIQVFDIH